MYRPFSIETGTIALPPRSLSIRFSTLSTSRFRIKTIGRTKSHPMKA
jgi:hypothetical protein